MNAIGFFGSASTRELRISDNEPGHPQPQRPAIPGAHGEKKPRTAVSALDVIV